MLSNLRTFAATAAAAVTLGLAGPALADGHMNPTVGGAPMYADKPIAANASAAPNLTTLVAAVKAAGLVDTLAGPGPFTVFAPTNDAFAKLPAGTVDTLLKPENKDQLTKILTCHVAEGVISAENIMKTVEMGNGMATIKTLGGCDLTAMVKDGMVMLKDPKGDVATVSTADVKQSNGMVHVIDTVMLPKM
ncbi:fasciclin domain-containing protein [Thioclava atlantica]|uniref:Beta-Ig-H3/fasciclin n=1 Tax=Thioclava atlantica TaxID=1317124 RepID=A0A085U1H5_9RHOB|nr:fasciclin domain-containing protein [Thioclava atlantica]KFE36822.1 beta-Ig-H3/fasciclin [Thioclava atlantica]